MGDENSFAFLVLDGERRLVEDDPAVVPMGGELSLSNRYNRRPGEVVDQMAAMRQTSLNRWPGDALDTIAAWRDNGDLDVVARRMGYRLSLRRARLPAHAGSDQPLPYRLHIHNSGFAAPVNPRPVDLVLWDGRRALRFPIDLDVRSLAPGSTTVVDVELAAGTVPPGRWEQYLALPDPAPRLADRPAFSIRLADRGTWDSVRGWNRLGATLTVVADG